MELSTEVKMGGAGGGGQSTVNDTIHVPQPKLTVSISVCFDRRRAITPLPSQ